MTLNENPQPGAADRHEAEGRQEGADMREDRRADGPGDGRGGEMREGPVQREVQDRREVSDRYGGDISCMEAWRKLRQEPDSALVDVRTRAEWTFVGVPDLSSLEKETVLVEWLDFPDGKPIPDFAGRLREALRQKRGTPQEENRHPTLLFLCRSGTRSRAAAQEAAQAGLGICFNVVEGFEGRVDSSGHRCAEGWKVVGLPWRQN